MRFPDLPGPTPAEANLSHKKNMRVIGNVTHDADKATTTKMLARAALLRPEIMTSSVVTLFERSYSTFSSFLGRRGLNKAGLVAGMNTPQYRVIGNRKVMWWQKGYPLRKGNIVSHTGGSTPGANRAEFTVVINTDFFSQNDNLELEDRDTLLHVLSKSRTTDGNWAYRVKLVHNRPGAYCPPYLLETEREIGFGHTAFPELSSDAGEKSTYGEWHAEWIGIQRMKHTISGSAKATKVWLEHNGVRTWDYQQNIDMYQRWAMAHEHQLIFGRSSVDAADKMYVQDDLGRDIIQGNGIIAQGDASMRFYYSNLTMKQLDTVMQELSIQQTGDGTLEVALVCGNAFYSAVQTLFREQVRANPIQLVEKTADGLEYGTPFVYYLHNGVRLHIMKSKMFDSPFRPIGRDAYGNSLMSQRAFFVDLGNAIGGEPNIQCLTLGNGEEDRRFVSRVINGMTGSGPQVGTGTDKMMLASSPVDGMQVHVLSESGVVMRNNRGFAQMIKSRN